MSRTSIKRGEPLDPSGRKGESGLKVLSADDLRALVRLLGDSDRRIARLARERLLEAGTEALPYLREAAADPDPLVRGRARILLEELRIEELAVELARFSATAQAEPDLEEGCFLLARYALPDLDPERYRLQLDAMADQCRTVLRPGLDMYRIIGVINTCLFEQWRFHGEDVDFLDPDSSYLPRVLDRRCGLPIALSTVYLLVARRLGLPVFGVGLPGHFILQYRGPRETVWIDPFHRGRLLSRRDCERLLHRLGYPLDGRFLQPVSNRYILARTVMNLGRAYGAMGRAAAVRHMERFRDILGRLAAGR